ncbi:peptidoglycan -binding protein [Octadecabacter sp.]|nr:peptidoglycan -binding protein [Octadecabacter sp.]
MALSRRTGARLQASIWPGFVDAMTGLLLVLMFVLTIFMVLQFVLQETITGQETELSELNAEVAALASALGLEQDRSATLGSRVGALSNELSGLQAELAEREGQLAEQSTLIAQLTAQRDNLTADLSDAETQITGFEVQVAGLLAQRRDAAQAIEELETREAELLSAQDALNLALAQARTEIDEGAEAARLAAARREALDAMIADLEAQGEAAAEQISELEAAKLVDAAAAQALRDRLENADAELTAMTLALEEQRQQAEDTLTLLAAAQSAQRDLDENLAIALLAQQEAETAAETLGLEREELAAELAQVLEGQGTTLATAEELRAQLSAALLARTELEADIEAGAQERGALSAELASAVAALAAAQSQTNTAQTDLDARAALLAQANEALSQEQALSAESQRQVALLNQQVTALRAELGRLQGLLDLANDEDVTANVQIETLTQDLNTAMARALLAERRANALEEAELQRLAEEAVELERYRSDFLGLLRDVLEGVDGVRIEGDRFVFSSEVLFEQGAADLSPLGQQEIAKIAGILRDVAGEIPEGIDWVIRVDGHTDNVPLSGLGEFANNWELSQARALSVVLYMVNFLGIPPNRLAANGFGQYQPLNPTDTDEARAQNRRIELKLTER